MAATIAAVYPHMNHIGGDGFWLVREPSGRVRALMAAGRAGANARRELYRELRDDPAARSACGAHRAGRDRGLDAGAGSGQGPWRTPAARRSAGARDPPRRARAMSSPAARRGSRAEKLAELQDVPGFAPTFLVDGKPPDAGTTLTQTALAATLDHLAHAGLDDFYRGDVGREIAGDLERVGSPVTRADLERCRATLAEPLSVALDAGTVFNTPPPTQGLASLMILALFERLGIKRGRRLRSCPWAGRGDQARLPRARPRDHRSRSPAASGRALSRAEFLDARSAQDRPPQGRALAGAVGRGRHRLDGRRRRRRASSSPTSSRSIGSSARAWCCRAPAC